MSLRVHVFQHVPFEGLGCLDPIFREVQARVTYTCYFKDEAPPKTGEFDFLVVMGGPMGVYDEEEYPWLVDEKRALKEALAAGKPILGICLGAQLLAEVLGGAVSKNRHKEIGWWPVEQSPESFAAWVSRIFPKRFTTFHWHGDTFAIPPGAVPLFHSEGCAHQGFLWGKSALGLQFHPEIMPTDVDSWVKNGEEELRPGGPYVQNPEQIRGCSEYFQANNAWMTVLCLELMRLA